MMKRILAILLAALMVMSVMVFTTAAEETETPAPVEFIPIFTEDEAPDTDMTLAELKAWRPANGNWNWTNATSYDGDEKAVVVSGTGTIAKAAFILRYCTDLLDISAMKALCFDLYISDLELANIHAESWKLQLYTTTARNDASAISLDRYLSTFARTGLKQGWNHFEIPIQWFLNNGTKGSAYVANQFAGFRLYNNSGKMGAADETTTFMIKNIYFTAQPQEFVVLGEGDMPNKDFTLADGTFFGSANWHPKRTFADSGSVASAYPYNANDNASNWGQWTAYSSMVTFGYHGASDRGVYATLTGLPATPKAGTFKFTYTINNSAAYSPKVADYEKFAFDFYVSDLTTANYKNVVWRFQILDYASNTMTYETTLQNLGYLAQKAIVAGWNHFEIPMSAFTGYDAAKASGGLTKQFLIQSQDTTNALGADGKTLTVAVKNFKFTNRSVDAYIFGGGAALKNETGTPASGWNSAEPMTWESSHWNWYTTNGCVLTYDKAEHAAVATVEGAVKAQKRVDFTMQKGQSANFTVDSVKSFCFDFYISDITDASATTEGWRLQIKDKAGTWAKNAAGQTRIEYTLPQYAAMSGTTLVEGWNHIEIPLSLFATLPTGNFYEFQFYNGGGTIGAENKTLTFKMRNVYCGRTYDFITFEDVAPTLNDSFKLTYNLTTDETFATVPMVEFSITDPAGESYRYAKAEVMAGATANTFTASFDRILANRLSDVVTVTAKALNKNGEIVVATETFTMRDYCDTMLGQSDDATLNALLSDTLRYGAAVQKVGSYNLENLATDITNASKLTTAAALDTATLAAFTANPLNGSATEGGPVWKSATLVLSGAVNIRYTFTATSVDELTVSVNGTTYDKDDFVSKGNDTYYVEVPVNAAFFNEDFVAQFGADDTYTVTYSVNAYIARNYKRFNDKDGGSDMYNLIVAIYNYGVSAANYVANH